MVDDVHTHTRSGGEPPRPAAPGPEDAEEFGRFFAQVQDLARETGLFALQLAKAAAREYPSSTAFAAAVDGLRLCTREMRDVLATAQTEEVILEDTLMNGGADPETPAAVYRASVAIAYDVAAALDEMVRSTETIAQVLAAEARRRQADGGAAPVRVDLVALERRASGLAQLRAQLHARLAGMCERFRVR